MKIRFFRTFFLGISVAVAAVFFATAVQAYFVPLSVSCSVTPNPAIIDQQVSFTSTATGGTGLYAYSWTGACLGSSPVCSTAFYTPGNKQAVLTVTSGPESATALCEASVSQNCAYHAYQQCVGNNLQWFDSCGNAQDYFFCPNGCAGSRCVEDYPLDNYTYYEYNYNKLYNRHANYTCRSGNLYWMDSLNRITGDIYKNCSDGNSCTIESCGTGKCVNTLKCDRSTCKQDSADFAKYCSAQQPQQPEQPGQQTQNGLSISFSVRTDESADWQENIEVGPGKTIYFMAEVKNESTQPIEMAGVFAQIPNEVAQLGNLQIDGASISGDIVNGVGIGTVLPSGSKKITFEGITGAISAFSEKQAVASVDLLGNITSDSVATNFLAEDVAVAPVSNAGIFSGFWNFLKQWYLWILLGAVLIFLFVVVFRRLSSE